MYNGAKSLLPRTDKLTCMAVVLCAIAGKRRVFTWLCGILDSKSDKAIGLQIART